MKLKKILNFRSLLKFAFIIPLAACSTQPKPADLSRLEKIEQSAQAAESRRDRLTAEKKQLEGELEREKQALADFEQELASLNKGAGK